MHAIGILGEGTVETHVSNKLDLSPSYLLLYTIKGIEMPKVEEGCFRKGFDCQILHPVKCIIEIQMDLTVCRKQLCGCQHWHHCIPQCSQMFGAGEMGMQPEGGKHTGAERVAYLCTPEERQVCIAPLRILRHVSAW